MSFYSEVENLTLELVQIPSINNTPGEKHLADKVLSYFQDMPYFQNNPHLLFEKELRDDRFGRKNVFALLEGRASRGSKKTVILHGHLDTVGIEDYGELMDYAFNPKALANKLKEFPLPEEAREDLESGEWMFGRGSSDMKSGLASHMTIVKYYSENIEQLAGNLLFMANPIEENQHTGIMEALSVLEYLQEKKGLQYQVAINSDFISGLYPGDTAKYIYLGAVGKLLPTFYIVGKETHAGQCFEGFDPNLLASELVKKISANSTLCDGYGGEYTLPPVSLKLTDTKQSYNVQTPTATYLYFNLFTHARTSGQVIELLEEMALEAFHDVTGYLNEQYKNYCRKAGMAWKPLPWKPKVYKYEELYRIAVEKRGGKLVRALKSLAEEEMKRNQDTRIICRKIVEKVIESSDIRIPAIILFLSPPYNPNNTLKKEVAEEKQAIDRVNKVLEEMRQTSKEDFIIKHYFPYTSDSSYLKIDDNEESLENLIKNFPGWHTVYPVPVEKIKKINIPAINIGAYGKDAHKWTERVHKPYSFSLLPELTIKAVKAFLT